jgi:hypothetical protein
MVYKSTDRLHLKISGIYHLIERNWHESRNPEMQLCVSAFKIIVS